MSRLPGRGDPGPDPAFVKITRAGAGAALGSVLAGLPVLWGQLGVPVILSVGLALFWTVLVVTAFKTFGAPARILLLAAPMAWLWPVVAAWLTWGG